MRRYRPFGNHQRHARPPAISSASARHTFGVTDQDDPWPEDDELRALAGFALRHALESVAEASGPLVPFNVFDVGGQHHLRRHLADTWEGSALQAIASFRGEADELQADLGVSVRDGYLDRGTERTDAMLVQGQRRGTPQSLLVGQRYRLNDPPNGTYELIEAIQVIQPLPSLFEPQQSPR